MTKEELIVELTRELVNNEDLEYILEECISYEINLRDSHTLRKLFNVKAKLDLLKTLCYTEGKK